MFKRKDYKFSILVKFAEKLNVTAVSLIDGTSEIEFSSCRLDNMALESKNKELMIKLDIAKVKIKYL